MGSGFFLNQAFLQTPSLPAFARLSWRAGFHEPSAIAAPLKTVLDGRAVS